MEFNFLNSILMLIRIVFLLCYIPNSDAYCCIPRLGKESRISLV